MKQHGVRFQPRWAARCTSRAPTRSSSAAARRWSTRITARPKRSGVEVLYDTEVVGLAIEGGRFESATVRRHGAQQEIRAKAWSPPAGGFESNLAWLREAWGPPADNFIVRGTPYNMGRC